MVVDTTILKINRILCIYSGIGILLDLHMVVRFMKNRKNRYYRELHVCTLKFNVQDIIVEYTSILIQIYRPIDCFQLDEKRQQYT